jgi:hypothetical protein
MMALQIESDMIVAYPAASQMKKTKRMKCRWLRRPMGFMAKTQKWSMRKMHRPVEEQ